jgi:hypothetical protein
MPKIHVLEGSTNNIYSVVVHAPTPAGNNAAGVSWTVAIANSGHAVSSLPVGNGPGQISQSELNQVQSGALIEAALQWQDVPSWTQAERDADLDLRANQAVTAILSDYQARLNLYGMTRT